MIFLYWPKSTRRQDLGYHGLPGKTLLYSSYRSAGQVTLGIRGSKNRRSIAEALVAELTTIIKGVDITPVVVEQGPITDSCRVVVDFNRLVVTRVIALLGGILKRSTGKT